MSDLFQLLVFCVSCKTSEQTPVLITFISPYFCYSSASLWQPTLLAPLSELAVNFCCCCCWENFIWFPDIKEQPSVCVLCRLNCSFLDISQSSRIRQALLDTQNLKMSFRGLYTATFFKSQTTDFVYVALSANKDSWDLREYYYIWHIDHTVLANNHSLDTHTN